jgi:hypothetical protein
VFVSPNGLTLLLWNVKRHRAACKAYIYMRTVSRIRMRARARRYILHIYLNLVRRPARRPKAGRAP